MPVTLRLTAPRHANRTVLRRRKSTGAARVTPRRPANAELRAREYLTANEVRRLMKVAGGGRHGQRDAAMILLGYRHGLRPSEIANLQWSQVKFGRDAMLHVRRVKRGKPSAHPLRGAEVRALRELRRKLPGSAFVFVTERGGPFTAGAVNRHIKRIGARAGLRAVHAHMLRHGCGFALAKAGHDTRAIQDWLGGHRPTRHTVRYTAANPSGFRNFWRD